MLEVGKFPYKKNAVYQVSAKMLHVITTPSLPIVSSQASSSKTADLSSIEKADPASLEIDYVGMGSGNLSSTLQKLYLWEKKLYEEVKPTITGEIQSPMGVASVEFIDPREPVAQYLLKEKEGKLDIATKPTEETEAKNPANSTFEEVITQEVEQTPEIKIETVPADFRFPTTNQTRHCFTRYIEYHRCVAARGDGASECNKFAKYYRALCPGEWVERWNEQRETDAD